MTRWRFEGEITGLGSGAGVRIVVGHWSRSPLGEFTDVMVELADGHRVLLAPSAAVRDFVTATYVMPSEVRMKRTRSATTIVFPESGRTRSPARRSTGSM